MDIPEYTLMVSVSAVELVTRKLNGQMEIPEIETDIVLFQRFETFSNNYFKEHL